EGEQRGVWRDDDVRGPHPFHRKVGHTKGLVPSAVSVVAGTVRGFRHAPRNAQLTPVQLLDADGSPDAGTKERVVVALHEERRHRVLEHRAAPGYERPTVSVGCQFPSEMEPRVPWNVAFRNRQEDGRSRLGCEQAVAG